MLINALHDEESRVAIVEDEYLHELDIESAHKVLTKSNIYKAKVTKVEGSLQAAFVEYGAARQGFLSLSEIHPDYWKEGVDKSTNPRNLSIQDILQAKQELLVQVVKEERGNKGAALTTHISLAGRYLVLSPNTSRGGISRKLSDDERRSMKEILKQLEVPDNMGLIIRTAGKDQTLEALQRDYNYLRRLWDEIRITSETTASPALIYLEGDLATRAIRDHFSDDIQEIWVDNHEIYTRTKAFVHAVLPGKEKLVKLYRAKNPSSAITVSNPNVKKFTNGKSDCLPAAQLSLIQPKRLPPSMSTQHAPPRASILMIPLWPSIWKQPKKLHASFAFAISAA